MKKAARIYKQGTDHGPAGDSTCVGVGLGEKLLFEKDGGGIHVRPVRTKSPFEKYRGIGDPWHSAWQEGRGSVGS